MKKVFYIFFCLTIAYPFNSAAKGNFVLANLKQEARTTQAGFINVLGDTDFGDVLLGNSQVLTFTIENDPSALENLSIFSIELLDGNPDFSISDNPLDGTISIGSIDLAPGETITFSITFEPGVAGLSQETVSIQSSDDFFTDGFLLDIAGTGLDPCEDVLFNINVFNAICPGDALDIEETEADADFYEWTGPNGFYF